MTQKTLGKHVGDDYLVLLDWLQGYMEAQSTQRINISDFFPLLFTTGVTDRWISGIERGWRV